MDPPGSGSYLYIFMAKGKNYLFMVNHKKFLKYEANTLPPAPLPLPL
jgi:hypothetical protein